MSQERNWAQHDRQVETAPTDAQCRDLARSHVGYGWAKYPYGGWTAEQVAAYNEAFDQAVQEKAIKS